MQMLPRETLDHILDLLHDDFRSLGACALASRIFLQTARYHRFSGRNLSMYGLRTLASLAVASPDLAASVLSLSFTPAMSHSETVLRQALGVIEHFPNLTEFRTTVHPAIVASCVPRLSVLRLEGVYTTAQGLIDGLSCLPHLEELELIRIYLSSDNFSPLKHRPAPRLRKICFWGGNCATTISDWLSSVKVFPAFCSLRHEIRAREDVLDFIESSRPLASLVQELDVRFVPYGGMNAAMDSIDFTLTSFQALHSCALRFAFSEMCVPQNLSLPWIPIILAQLASSHLRTLTISVVVDNVEDLRSLSSECAVRVLSPAYFDDMRVLDWVAIGNALTDERLCALRRVVMEGQGKSLMLEDHVKTICPVLHSRGILSMTPVSANIDWIIPN